MKIISVVGARPNFMKMAPVHKAFAKLSKNIAQRTIQHLICHTGQHYDEKMSKVFFEDLELPEPDFYLRVGPGSHVEQTAKIMIEFEKVLLQEKPSLVMVYGDVNSTVACALTAVKLNIKVAHVEAGLRSFDRTMLEEINRILTDQVSDYLFVTEQSGVENLKREGIEENKIFFVGNTMIDSLIESLPKAEKSSVLRNLKLMCDHMQLQVHEDSFIQPYILVTLHRPSNVDNRESVEKLVELFNVVAHEVKIVFPVHPRTRKNFELWNITHDNKTGIKFSENVLLTAPIPYIDSLALMKNAKAVVTDSGGIQEETTFLGIPCLTLRENTERPVTITHGTNQLTSLKSFPKLLEKLLDEEVKSFEVPKLWDGKASYRIVENLNNSFNIPDKKWK